MRVAEPVCAAWKAELSLEFEGRNGRTVLARKRHDGPLQVQKPLYPEGDAVCHAIVVHPPAGIAGGDELEISATVGRDSHALLTTPGAGKWYRSERVWARQRLSFRVEGSLEWLPQETIVFDGAHADMGCTVDLAPDARYVGWEILCLGRTGSGERFERGECRVATAIRRDGKLLWIERGRIEGDGELMNSKVGLGGRSVCATLLACAPELGKNLIEKLRSSAPQAALTLLPGVFAARYLGDSSEDAKRCFARLWAALRPPLLGRKADEPRIWRT